MFVGIPLAGDPSAPTPESYPSHSLRQPEDADSFSRPVGGFSTKVATLN